MEEEEKRGGYKGASEADTERHSGRSNQTEGGGSDYGENYELHKKIW